MVQPTLFGGGAVYAGSLEGARRIELGSGAWVAHRPGWVRGHDVLFAHLFRTTRWHQGRRRMYDRMVDVPRLTARLPEDGPGHPLLPELATRLSRHFDTQLERISLACYRDGRDSVAPHGDKVGALRDDCVVGIVSVGHPRRFLIRPAGGGRSKAFALGWGDLFVMGGTAQRTFEHSVPKVASAEPRISIMFRPALPPES